METLSKQRELSITQIRWTGQPLVDVGIATLCAMANRNDPGKLTAEDLDRAAQQMKEYYFSGYMNSYLTCVFMNSAYVQPAMGKEETKEYTRRVLYAHRWAGDEAARGLTCSVSGERATHVIHRGQMPLLTGQEVLNFFPHGRGGLPIAGPYLVALQALPLGSRRAEGRLLAAHSDAPWVSLELAKLYLQDNQRLMELATTKKLPGGDGPFAELVREQAAYDKVKKTAKFPDAKAPTSLIATDLMEIYQRRGPSDSGHPPTSCSVYWLSSSGQGPSLEIFHIPSQALRFLVLASSALTAATWKRLVAAGWRQPGERKSDGRSGSQKRVKGSGAQSAVPGGAGRSRNEVLADLFSVFEAGFIDRNAATGFLRRHFLRHGWHQVRAAVGGAEADPRVKLGIDRADWIDWPLTKLFVKEMLGMDEKRVEAIREFADKMADFIARSKDREVFRDLVYGRWAWQVRNALTKAQRNRARELNELLFGLDDYLKVFVADEAIGKGDWSLVRDLISIRLVEQLYKKDFFKGDNEDLLQEPEKEAVAN